MFILDSDFVSAAVVEEFSVDEPLLVEVVLLVVLTALVVTFIVVSKGVITVGKTAPFYQQLAKELIQNSSL